MNTSETTEALVAELTDMAEVMESLGDLRKARVLRASAERMKQLQCDIPTWISVDERLPEREGVYLVHQHRRVKIGKFYSYLVNDEPRFDYWVTHWMPLPEPPSETRGM